MRHALHTEIEIAAAPQDVWAVLTDFAAYPSWNPFITEAAGTLAAGQRLTLRMEPPGGRGMTFRPTVTEAEPPRVFEWLGHLGIAGLFDGRHRFELHHSKVGTRLVQAETFGGLLVRPMRKSLDGPTLAGFRAMNEAIVRRLQEGPAHT